MIDIKIDPVTGNLVIENGDFVLVKDGEEIMQSLRIRLRMAIGDWFLDNRIGVDYFGKILKKNYSREEIATELKRVIRDTQGVTGITNFSLDIIERKLFISFTVSTIYQENLTIQEDLNI